MNRPVLLVLGIAISSALAGTLVGVQAADQGVTGKKLLMKPGKLVLLSKDPTLATMGSDPSAGGPSTISFNNGVTDVSFDLPQGFWTVGGTGSLLSYKNSSAPSGPSPIKIVKAKSGLLKVVAKDVPFPPPTGTATVSVVVTLDGGTNRYCMSFSGTGAGGKFLVKDASAGNCAVCGNGVREGAEVCDGGDSAACPGDCLSNCACPVCGNNVREGDEACDGSDDALCLGAGACESDCSCPEGLTCGGFYPSCGPGGCPLGQECAPYSSGGLANPNGCMCLDYGRCPAGQSFEPILGVCVSFPTCIDLYLIGTYPFCDTGGTPPGSVCQSVSVAPGGSGNCVPVGAADTCAGSAFGPCPTSQDCVASSPSNACRDRSFPYCTGEATTCGSCGSGACFTHGGATLTYPGPDSLCANTGACSVSSCSTDADCPAGTGCVLFGGIPLCCAPCS